MVVSNQVDEIKEIVAAAQSAVSDVTDKDLRVAAFNRVLDHLLTGESTKARKTRTKRKVVGDKEKAPGAKKKRPGDGPKARLEGLIEEEFFSEQKESGAILKALAERGYNLKLSDITWPLGALTRENKLRRNKAEPAGGGKTVWHYSNC